jgi:hypothetical protein
MAIVAKAKQGKVAVRWGTWLSPSGQLSYGTGEIMIEQDVYDTLKALPLPDRASYYRAEKEKKPEVAPPAAEEKKE